MPSLATCAGSWPQADAADGVLPEGTKARPIHRIQPVEIALHSVSGTSYGTGSLTFIAERDLATYARPITAKPTRATAWPQNTETRTEIRKWSTTGGIWVRLIVPRKIAWPLR